MTNFEFIDLQLLAATPIPNLNTTDPEKSLGEHEVKEYYDRVLLEYAGPNLVHDQFAKKANIPAGNGKSIEWRRLVDLDTTIDTFKLKEDEIPVGQEVGVEIVTAEIEELGGYIKLSDIVEIVAYDNIQTGYMKKLAEQASKISDKISREKLLEATGALQANGKSTVAALTATDTLTLKDVFKAAATLAAVDAPTIDGSYVAIIHPYVAYDLMMEAGNGWIDVMKYADPEKILNGEIGKIGNVRFVQSSMAKTYKKGDNGNTTTGTCVTTFLGADAYASVDLANGGIESITHNKHEIGGPLDQYATMGWKLRKAAEILTDKYIVKMTSATAAGTTTTN